VSLNDAQLALIEAFADALWLERGLSRNTLSAYQSDLRAFAGWLATNRRRDLPQAERADLLDYLAVLAAPDAARGRRPDPCLVCGSSTAT